MIQRRPNEFSYYNQILRRQKTGLIRASDSMFYPLTMCALQIVFMIMIIVRRPVTLRKTSEVVFQNRCEECS